MLKVNTTRNLIFMRGLPKEKRERKNMKSPIKANCKGKNMKIPLKERTDKKSMKKKLNGCAVKSLEDKRNC